MKSFLLCMLVGLSVPVFSFADESVQEVQPTVQDVRCEGNTETSCEFITGHLYLSRGDKLNENEIQYAKLRLSSLTNFKSVDVHLEKGSEKGQVVVVIEVTEASPITTELSLGTSYRNTNLGQNFGGRVSHQNLFGTGKILDLEMKGRIPLTESSLKDNSVRLQYADPHLMGSKKFFFTSGVSFADSRLQGDGSEVYSSEQLGVDVTIGRHIGAFSYLTLGYQYRPISKLTREVYVDETRTESRTDSSPNAILLGYGANSEDDAYFPTRGARTNLSLAFFPSYQTTAS